MDLKEQRYVLALAECGSLTRAAEKLFISQPALSVAISNLEKSLGLALFERKNRCFSLTYAGEIYVAAAREMLRVNGRLEESLRLISSEKTGRICLGISQLRGKYLLPPVVAAFEKQYPQVELRFKEGNLSFLKDWLKSGELDLLVVNAEDIADFDMEQVLLYEERFLLASSAGHPIGEHSTFVSGLPWRCLDPKRLCGEKLIVNTPTQSSRRVVDALLARHHVQPASIRVVRNIETSVQMAAEGLGLAFVREGYARHIDYHKPIRYFLLEPDAPPHRLVVAWRKDTCLTEYGKAVVSLLCQHGQRMVQYREK